MVPQRRASSRDRVDEAFGRVLRALRLEQGLSQEQLGHDSGSGRTYVSQLERAEKGASLKTLFRLAGALDVEPSEVVRLTEIEIRTSSATRKAR